MEKPKSSKQTNPVKAIRAYCLNCCLENANEVAQCSATGCELWEFRMGKNPYRAKQQLTPEQEEARRQRGREAMARLQAAQKHGS